MPLESSDQAKDPIDHKDVELFISRAWDGNLSPDETRWLVSHLRSCPDCAARSKPFLDFLARLGPVTDPGEPAEEA